MTNQTSESFSPEYMQARVVVAEANRRLQRYESRYGTGTHIHTRLLAELDSAQAYASKVESDEYWSTAVEAHIALYGDDDSQIA